MGPKKTNKWKPLTETYDSYGMPVSARIRAENEKKEAEIAMIEDISKRVEDAFLKGTLLDEPFHVIDFNIFVSTDEIHDLAEKYRPAEVAAVEYTIRHGVTRKFHALLHPDNIPLGYRSDAKQHQEIHGIRLELQGDFLDSNYPEIVVQLLNLVKSSRGEKKYHPFYTMPDEVEKVTSLLEWLWRRGERGDETNPFLVYELNHLLFHLRKVCPGEHLAYPSSVMAADVLCRSCYDHVDDIACLYHQKEIEITKPCVLSLVTREAYIISDEVCEHFGVTLLPHKHCPVMKDATAPAVDEELEASMRSMKQIARGNEERDEDGLQFQEKRRPIVGRGRGNLVDQLAKLHIKK